MNMLQLEHIDAGYGNRKVLRDLSLEVDAGELISLLIGPNGAGKSTVIRVVAGFLQPWRGHVWFDGENITDLAPHERIEQGVGYCIQGGRVFPSLSVAENLEMGGGRLFSEEWERGKEQVLNLFPNLKPLLDRNAGVLSGGEQQALALGMVLIRRPELLLLDEPSAGLSPRLVDDLLVKIQALSNDWGITILLVEQNIRVALKLADRVSALVDGRKQAETDHPKAWLEEERIEEVFLKGT